MDRDLDEAVRICEELRRHVYRQCLEKCKELTRISDCGCNLVLADLEEICLASMGIEVEMG